jgi:hypothetical protein
MAAQTSAAWSRLRWWVSPLAIAIPLLAVGIAPPGAAAPAGDSLPHVGRSGSSGRTYYVSLDGSDLSLGRTPASAVRTLAAASVLPLRPGDRLLLRRGGRYDGLLSITASGSRAALITVGAFGHGRPPSVTGRCLELLGSWIQVRSVRAHDCRAGITSQGQHNTIRGVEADHNLYGVEIGLGARNNRVLHSLFDHNTVMAADTPGPDDDYGANAIVVRGDEAEIAYNVMRGQVAASPDFGTDGAAVEIYGAIGTRVHHNTAVNNRAFTELGDPRSRDTRYTANVTRSSLPHSQFLVTRGPRDAYGPVARTSAKGNIVVNTGTGSQGFWCGGGCTESTLRLIDNVIYAVGSVGYVDGAISGRGNIYGGGLVQFPLLDGDTIVASLLQLLGSQRARLRVE